MNNYGWDDSDEGPEPDQSLMNVGRVPADIWLTKKGEVIPIWKLEDSHLQAIDRMAREGRLTLSPSQGLTLGRELGRRGLQQLTPRTSAAIRAGRSLFDAENALEHMTDEELVEFANKTERLYAAALSAAMGVRR